MEIFLMTLRVIVGMLVLAGFYMSGAHTLNSLADKNWKQFGVGLVLTAFFVLIIMNFP